MVPKATSTRAAWAAAGVLCTGFANASQAAVVTYDFTNATSAYELSRTFTPGGTIPVLTVTANTVNANGTLITPVTSYGVGQWLGLGLGIKNSSSDNSHTIDGSGLNDLLVLDFSSSVTFVSATFTYAGRISGSHDGFAFFADDDDGGTGVEGNMIFSQQDIGASGYPNYTGTFDFLAHDYNISSTTFAIGAILDYFPSPCPTRYNPTKTCKVSKFDSFKLASISVDYTPPEVPLPAGLILLLSGLTGLGFVSRLKSKAAD